jgi:UDP-N-acetylmuramate dehydrogenase
MSLPQEYKQQLTALARLDIGICRFDEPLAKHTSWKIGGCADLLVEPSSITQVSTLLQEINRCALPYIVIGQGTNLLFDDAGVRGVVLKIGAQMAAICFSGHRIVVSGGCWVPQLARLAMKQGLTGLEHCIGIPGSIGGLVAMNGGSQRKGIGDNVVSVTVVASNGEVKILTAKDCQFAYRRSNLQGSGMIVVEVELNCPQAVSAEVRHEMLNDLRIRRTKFPRKIPNCGSVFLSTAAMHASVGPPGKIIEELGLKGFRCGQAEISTQHANFILNRGNASAEDILKLIAYIRCNVRQKIGFDLDCEVRYVSPEGKITPAHLVADQYLEDF